MTCALCKYEFCWACGESASSADRHFSAMRGCGVRMMDDTVKAGRYAINIDGDDENRSKCDCFKRCCHCHWISRNCCKKFWIAIACILLLPFILVVALPGFFVYCYEQELRYRLKPSCLCKTFVYFLLIFLGLLIDTIFVPFLIIWGSLFFLFKLWSFMERGFCRTFCCCFFMCRRSNRQN